MLSDIFIPGVVKVFLYIAFMTIMIKVHTFPLFAIRPMYLAMRWAIPLLLMIKIFMMFLTIGLWCWALYTVQFKDFHLVI